MTGPRLCAAAVAAAAVFITAGCGGEEDPPTPTEAPAKLLASAAANPAPSGEAQIDVGMELEGETPLAGVAGFDGSGPFDFGDGEGIPAFELDGEADAAGFGFDTDLISTGDDAFVVFFGESYRVGPDRYAEAEQALASATGGGGFGLDVAGWFRDPAYAGTEDVGGTATEKIEGTLDADAAAGDLAALAESVGAPPFVAALAAGAGSGPVEAWVSYPEEGEAATVRRLSVQFPFTVPPGQIAQTRGVESGTVAIDAEIWDVGADVTIGVPEGGGFQPIEDLTSRLESLASLGGL